MLKEAKSKGIDYYYMDHAYFKPGYSGKGWMRITKNGHACTILRDIANVSRKGFSKMQDIIWNSMQKIMKEEV